MDKFIKVEKPLISVVMPVFNGEEYLREAIESILKQTYDNFEFIIVNDGSTDRTESIILSFQDPRILYIKQENAGVGEALNKGCSYAKGKYIARMDADDVSLENRLSIQLKYLEKHSKVILVSSAVKYINKTGKVTGRSFPYTSHKSIKNKLAVVSPICHPGVMMRTEILKKTGGYLNIQPFEDLFLWRTFLDEGKLHNLTVPLLQYRILDDSVSHKISNSNKNKLLKFLTDRFNNHTLNGNAIIEYQALYTYVKKERSTNNTKTNRSTIEQKVYKIYTKSKLPDFFIEKLICSIKNILSLFKRNTV